MPRFYSQDFPRFSYDQTTLEPKELPGLELPASTLAAFLAGIQVASGIRVIPHDPPKYFRYYPKDSTDFYLVDIHVDRGGLEICPKQDLSFLLEDGDAVEAGLLAC